MTATRGKPRVDKRPSLPRLLAEELRRDAPPRYFRMEKYGSDGEIEEAWESHPLGPEHDGVEAIIISGTGCAEPRTDWRERGVVPPRGFHRRAEIEGRRLAPATPSEEGAGG